MRYSRVRKNASELAHTEYVGVRAIQHAGTISRKSSFWSGFKGQALDQHGEVLGDLAEGRKAGPLNVRISV